MDLNPNELRPETKTNLSLLLEFLNGTLVNTSALVDQVSSGGGLSGVDMSNDDNVNMNLFLSHGC